MHLKGQHHELLATHTLFSDQNLRSFGGRFQDSAVAKFMMASSGVGHGGKSSNSGRKRIISDVKGAKKEWKRCHKHIYLASNIFKVQRRACAAHDTVPLNSWGHRLKVCPVF